MSDKLREYFPQLSREQREFLERVFREGLVESGPDLEWPDAETVTAYLQGAATEEEILQVQSAMVRSAEFREEMVALLQGFRALQEGAAHLEPQTDVSEKSTAREDALVERYRRGLRSFFERRWVAGAVAATAVIALLVMPLLRQGDDVPESLRISFPLTRDQGARSSRATVPHERVGDASAVVEIEVPTGLEEARYAVEATLRVPGQPPRLLLSSSDHTQSRSEMGSLLLLVRLAWGDAAAGRIEIAVDEHYRRLSLDRPRWSRTYLLILGNEE